MYQRNKSNATIPPQYKNMQLLTEQICNFPPYFPIPLTNLVQMEQVWQGKDLNNQNRIQSQKADTKTQI